MRVFTPPTDSIQPGVLASLALMAAAVSGMVISRSPRLIVPLVGCVAVVALASLGRRVERIFLIALTMILIGYAFQARAFAYWGIPPLYVGELVLGLGLACLGFARIKWRVSYLHLTLFAFTLLGLARTVPYYGKYHLDAVRDAALWYYMLYAFVVSLVITKSRLESALRVYARVLPALVIWLACMPIVFRLLPVSLPHFPGSPLPVLAVSQQLDRCVFLAGLAAFVLTGLWERSDPSHRLSQSAFWLCWMVGTLLVILNRGSMLAIASALLLVALVQPSRKWLPMAGVGGFVVVLLIVINPTVSTIGNRKLSVSQLTTNVTSIFSDTTENHGSVQSTKDWRLSWWTKIYDYTFHGPYFWTGKGFGINLADADGFQVIADHSLRSPHNSHMTVLARMGVPGLALWVLFQLSFAGAMLRAYLRARAAGLMAWAGFDLWILAIWLAVIVDSMFTVYLESPQGAIPFWCAVGFGLAGLRMQRQPDGDLLPASSRNHIPRERVAATSGQPESVGVGMDR